MKTRKIKQCKILKTPQKYLIHILDMVFSIYIRFRDNHICFTCDARLTSETSQAGHYIGRKYISTRFDLRNVNCQCAKCNQELHGNIGEYEKRLKIKYGDNVLIELHEQKMICKPRIDFVELIKIFKNKLKEQFGVIVLEGEFE